MIRKLRLKFVAINMVIVVVMLLVIFSMVYHTTRLDLERQSELTLQNICQSTLQSGQMVEKVQLPYFTITIGSRGTVVAAGNAGFDLTDTDFLGEIMETVFKRGQSSGDLPEYDLRYLFQERLGTRCIAFVDISGQQSALNALIRTSAVIGLLGTVVFLLISIFLARWAVKPVAQAWEQQKQFVSDASHELKTPLTVILSNAELLQDPQCPEQIRQQSSQNIQTMSHQMCHLVEGLLELSRADNGQVKINFANMDFSKLVSDSLLPFEPVLFEKGLYLESQIAPGIQVLGSAQHLKQVLDILLDNAAKYSSPGVVCVTLQCQSKGCLLYVSSPGVPIAKKDLTRIFDRFYRADQARSRDGSFGLGLAIAQTIVREHQGRIWAESNETGNRFGVYLPLH